MKSVSSTPPSQTQADGGQPAASGEGHCGTGCGTGCGASSGAAAGAQGGAESKADVCSESGCHSAASSPRRLTMGRALLLVVLVAIVLWLMGCAVFEEDYRRTLNALDESCIPASATMRWVAVPVTLPTGIVALVADMVLVHPACSVDDAWLDTVDALWTSRGQTRFRRAVLLPLVTIATPFVFVGDWLGRCLFPIDPHEDADAPAKAGT
ncbi:MAG: hypothetical protein ACT4PU_12350 [Planctomycetota bacterium]